MKAFTLFHKWDALCDLVPFAQFKKGEKHPWRSVTFSKVAGLLKVTLFHFLDCANCATSRKAPPIYMKQRFATSNVTNIRDFTAYTFLLNIIIDH